MRLTGTLVLVLGVLVFAGSAYAGNGNGNGNGRGNDGAAPGNSADAPGQVKKDEQAVAPPADTTTTTAAAPVTVTTAAANATGVKPSNETAHDTHAEAQSDKTKQYGNGQTAGQVAQKNGAKGNTVLHGPGNSQPHKASPCSGGHEVDVHALKSHRSGNCGDPAPHPQPNPGPPVVTTTATTSGSVTTTTTTSAAHESTDSDPGSKPAHGESGGATADETQGALAATGHTATLPFTGRPLWLAVLLGFILILTGLALREIRSAEASVESGHDHTDRSRHAARSARATRGGRAGR